MIIRNFKKIGISLFWTFFFSLVWCGGCAGPEQKAVVKAWFDACFYVEKEEKAQGGCVPSSLLLSKIGPPDYVIRGGDLAEVIPNSNHRETVIRLAASSLERVTESRKDMRTSGWGVGIVAAATFWFYDEAARYWLPSQPASFWGMGTGYQVVWFVVNDNNEIVAQGGWGFVKPISPSHRK